MEAAEDGKLIALFIDAARLKHPSRTSLAMLSTLAAKNVSVIVLPCMGKVMRLNKRRQFSLVGLLRGENVEKSGLLQLLKKYKMVPENCRKLKYSYIYFIITS